MLLQLQTIVKKLGVSLQIEKARNKDPGSEWSVKALQNQKLRLSVRILGCCHDPRLGSPNCHSLRLRNPNCCRPQVFEKVRKHLEQTVNSYQA